MGQPLSPDPDPSSCPRLAAEIARTDAAEREMQRLRAKFGRKLWQLDEEHAVSGSLVTVLILLQGGVCV